MPTLNPATLRAARADDIAACIAIRGRTRENPVSATRLAELGITAATWGQRVAEGRCAGWLALDVSDGVLGYAFGNRENGEVEVVALLPAAEGQGLGRRLLQSVVNDLRHHGHVRPWLMADASPRVRAHGFYRHLGWQPGGRHDANGDEALVLPADAMPSPPAGAADVSAARSA